MRIALCREAGGMGDVIRAMAPAARLAELGHQVEAFVVRGYDYYASRVSGIERVWPVSWAERWGDRTGRRERWAEVPYARAYFRRGGVRDSYVNLFCPAWDHEAETGGRPTLDRIECFFRAAGLDPAEAEAPQIAVDAREVSWGRGFLAGRGIDVSRPVVLLQPYTMSSARNWPLHHWRALVDELTAAGCSPVMVLTQARLGDCPCHQLVRLAPVELLRVAAAVDLAVVPDSGMLHLASAVGTPVVALFGPTDGALICKHYPRAVVVQGRPVGAYLGCQWPCHYIWERGIDEWCRRVACEAMASIPLAGVLGAVQGALPALSHRRGL